MLRVAIIGAGAFANSHAASIRAQAASARLVAVVDPKRERVDAFCAKHDIPAGYTDAAVMLAQAQPDVAVICSPPHTHAPLTLEALHGGAHVVCEKPLALSLAQIDQVQAAEQATGRTCTTIFQWRFGAAARHVRQVIVSGAAGLPRLAVCNTLWYRPPGYFEAAPWRAGWATAGGGVALALGIHAMDMTLWLMGDWQEVSATTSSLDRDVEVDTLALAQVRFAGGALGAFVNSVLSPRQESYVRLDLQRLTIELTHLYAYGNADWRFTPLGEGHAQAQTWAQIAGTAPGALETQWAHIVRALSAGEETGTRPADVRATYEFIASLYKSAATRQPVTRGSIDVGDPFYASMNG